MFARLCLRPATSQEDRDEIERIADVFEVVREHREQTGERVHREREERRRAARACPATRSDDQIRFRSRSSEFGHRSWRRPPKPSMQYDFSHSQTGRPDG